MAVSQSLLRGIAKHGTKVGTSDMAREAIRTGLARFAGGKLSLTARGHSVMNGGAGRGAGSVASARSSGS